MRRPASRPRAGDVGASGRRRPCAVAVGLHRQHPAGVVLEAVVGAAQADEVGLDGRAVGKAHDMVEVAPSCSDTTPGEPTGAIAVSDPLSESGIGSIPGWVARDGDPGERVGSGHAQHDIRVGRTSASTTEGSSPTADLGRRGSGSPSFQAEPNVAPSGSRRAGHLAAASPRCWSKKGRWVLRIAADDRAFALEELGPDRVLRCEPADPAMCSRSSEQATTDARQDLARHIRRDPAGGDGASKGREGPAAWRREGCEAGGTSVRHDLGAPPRSPSVPRR